MPIMTGKEKEIIDSQFGLAASGNFDMLFGQHFSVEYSYNPANLSVITLTPKTGDKTAIIDYSLEHVANVASINTDMLGGC
jgi:hypothetical protein